MSFIVEKLKGRKTVNNSSFFLAEMINHLSACVNDLLCKLLSISQRKANVCSCIVLISKPVLT